MDLNIVSIADAKPATTHKRASQVFQIAAGNGLRIQTGPPVVDQFEETCPAGKKWKAVVTVLIYEEAA